MPKHKQRIPFKGTKMYFVSNSTSGYGPKRMESRDLDNLYTCVHSSIIDNNKKVETAQVSTDR